MHGFEYLNKKMDIPTGLSVITKPKILFILLSKTRYVYRHIYTMLNTINQSCHRIEYMEIAFSKSDIRTEKIRLNCDWVFIGWKKASVIFQQNGVI